MKSSLSCLVAFALLVFSARAAVVNATWNASTDVPVAAASYTATGHTVNLTLSHVPAIGENLTVVNNTGLAFIQGTFGNLSQGQKVILTYSGKTYDFVANYYGGTGNDLVLQWAGQSITTWGSNSSGQLGNDSTTDSSVPFAVNATGVLNGKVVVAVSAGGSHSLALCSDGTVAAWGRNNYGQLGNNSLTDSKVPVAVNATGVLSGKTVVAISAGGTHSLALCSDGTVAAWGRNNYGHLGNNSTTDSKFPIAVNTTGALSGKTVVAVSAGNNHSLALCSDGTVTAWGQNTVGQLGNNVSTIPSTVPVAVDTTGVLNGKTVVFIDAGYEHSLALCTECTIAAWGANSSGQLGNNSTTTSYVPVAVVTTGILSGKTVKAVAAGSHSLALCSDGTVIAWGNNSYGKLGDNSIVVSNVQTGG